jgi:hypothetical protein
MKIMVCVGYFGRSKVSIPRMTPLVVLIFLRQYVIFVLPLEDSLGQLLAASVVE